MENQLSIQKLNSHVVDRIAAGEVVERPAHLIKELIENSLDAQAKNIEIQFSEGGLFSSIKDDGEGIRSQELSLALSRHATSKIKDSKDIFSLQTYGFRGEALASIASVSCLTLTSRRKDQSKAFRLKSEFGKMFNIEAVHGSLGTTVVVDKLFQNVPARLSFLKSESHETSLVNKVITAQALAHPKVTFRVIYKNKLLFFWQACDSYHQRAEMILSKPLYSKKFEEHSWVQEVILSPPNKTEKTSKKIRLFVNGRSIEDKALYGAILSAHRNVLMHGEYPRCVLHFQIPPVEVDVNVHPTKNQVRFRNPSKVFRMTQKTVRSLLEESPWLEELGQPSLSSHKKTPQESFSQYVFNSSELSQFESKKTYPKKKLKEEVAPQEPIKKTIPLEVQTTHEPKEESSKAQNFSALRVLAQAHKTYLVTQSQTSIVFIDQHAAHERILFEKIMNQFREGRIEKQKHLVPLIIQMEVVEVSAILSMKKHFFRLGIELESRKPNEIQILSSPLVVKEKALESSMKKLAALHVDRCEEFNIEKFVSDFAATSACHSAIRAGQVLSLSQMENLLEQMDEYPFSSFCPHGRPVFVEYPISQLEKDFCRTV